jgi:hypothetical protein
MLEYMSKILPRAFYGPNTVLRIYRKPAIVVAHFVAHFGSDHARITPFDPIDAAVSDCKHWARLKAGRL